MNEEQQEQQQEQQDRVSESESYDTISVKTDKSVHGSLDIEEGHTQIQYRRESWCSSFTHLLCNDSSRFYGVFGILGILTTALVLGLTVIIYESTEKNKGNDYDKHALYSWSIASSVIGFVDLVIFIKCVIVDPFLERRYIMNV